MTYAPPSLLRLRTYALDTLGAPEAGVGIVGDARHQHGYHLGWDLLVKHDGWSDYSATTARDRAALRGATRDAACAFDLTTASREHRRWLVQLVRDLLAGESYLRGLRAVNGSLDGRTAYRWDREAGLRRARTDDSHLWHTHLEFYRDVIAASVDLLPVLTMPLRDVGVFKRPAPARPVATDGEWTVSAEEKLDELVELLTSGQRKGGLTATAPDPELGSGYIAVMLRLQQQTAHRLQKTNELLTQLVKLQGGGK